MDKLREECGVFGVYASKEQNLASMTYYGLYALQHRGQDSCGIVVNDGGVFSAHKDLGLVGDVFTKEKLLSFLHSLLSPTNIITLPKKFVY